MGSESEILRTLLKTDGWMTLCDLSSGQQQPPPSGVITTVKDEIIANSAIPCLTKQNTSRNDSDLTSCYCCDLCERRFPSRPDLLDHELKDHKPQAFNCSVCSFSSADLSLLQAHIAAHGLTHPEVRNATSVPTASLSKVTKVKGRKRQSEKPTFQWEGGKFLCSYPDCNFRTQYEFNMTRHFKVHQKRRPSIESTQQQQKIIQRKKVFQKSQVVRQTEYEEQQPNPPKQTDNFRMHELKVEENNDSDGASEVSFEEKYLTGSATLELVEKMTEEAGKRGDGHYGCPRCDYGTPIKYNLKKHLMSHFDAKPFACRLCSYCTKWESNLKAHERSQHFGQIRPRKVKSKDSKSQRGQGGKKKKKKKKVKVKELDVRPLFEIPLVAAQIIESRVVNQPESGIYAAPAPAKPLKSSSKSVRRPSVTSEGSKTDESESIYDCPHCNYQSNNRRLLVSHLKTHSDERPFPCTFPGCNYRTKWSHWARVHERKIHGWIKPDHVSCVDQQSSSSVPPTATIVVPFKSRLPKPIAVKRRGPKTKLEKVAKGASFKAASLHNGANRTAADDEKESLLRRYGLDKKNWNCKEKTSCPVCGLRLLGRFLDRHILVHTNIKPFVCTVEGCSYRSRWAADVRTHAMRVHDLDQDDNVIARKLVAPKSKRTSSIAATAAIIFSKERWEEPKRPPPPPPFNDEQIKRFKCPECPYRGMTSWHVNRHRLIHGDLRPFQCSVQGCSFRTRERYNLKIHERRFHGEGADILATTWRLQQNFEDEQGGSCRFCDYLSRIAKFVRKHMRGCPRCSCRGEGSPTLSSSELTKGSEVEVVKGNPFQDCHDVAAVETLGHPHGPKDQSGGSSRSLHRMDVPSKRPSDNAFGTENSCKNNCIGPSGSPQGNNDPSRETSNYPLGTEIASIEPSCNSSDIKCASNGPSANAYRTGDTVNGRTNDPTYTTFASAIGPSEDIYIPESRTNDPSAGPQDGCNGRRPSAEVPQSVFKCESTGDESSTPAFACMLCEFVGESRESALEHATTSHLSAFVKQEQMFLCKSEQSLV